MQVSDFHIGALQIWGKDELFPGHQVVEGVGSKGPFATRDQYVMWGFIESCWIHIG